MSTSPTLDLRAIPAPIAAILTEHVPASIIRCILAAGTSYTLLHEGQPFADVSPTLRRIGAGVDGWPIAPAGLFVVEERSVIIRNVSAMTTCHESAHALDAALGGGVYLSGVDPRIRRAFARATAFVTPYAASACDEWFAENARAMLDRANDRHSLWPPATRARLNDVDPIAFELMSEIFADIETRFGTTPAAAA